MSRLIARMAQGAFLFIIVLFAATIIAANTSITQKAIQTEVIIEAPSSKVWQVLTDFDAYPEWNPFIRQINGTAIPGEQLTARMNFGGRTMTFSPTILVVQPEKELRWIGRIFIPGIFDGEHRFIIEPLGENQVRVTQGEVFNGLIVPFSGALLKDTESGFKAMNQALKERAEKMT
jgi:hypothetical protein